MCMYVLPIIQSPIHNHSAFSRDKSANLETMHAAIAWDAPSAAVACRASLSVRG